MINVYSQNVFISSLEKCIYFFYESVRVANAKKGGGVCGSISRAQVGSRDSVYRVYISSITSIAWGFDSDILSQI